MTRLALASQGTGGIPVHALTRESAKTLEDRVPAEAARWARATGFDGSAGKLCLVPDASGAIACALYGLDKAPQAMDVGKLPRLLPGGDYRLEGDIGDAGIAALGWLLGAYRFERYRKSASSPANLVIDETVDRAWLESMAQAVFLARDLVNTPTNDLGPAELEQAVRDLAGRFDAGVTSIVGDALLERNFPMVHAVGRASNSAPRIVDLTWGNEGDPKVTLVGKGVCFDTGGLNIKPGDSMSLMKKDMGGAANVLGLARLIMTAGLRVRLRVIVGAVEN